MTDVERPALDMHGGSLRSRVLSGLYWTGGARIASQVVTWATTIVVIRLLTPADYGLLAMATVFVSLLALLSEAGLGAAVIQMKDTDEHKLRRIFGAVIVVDVALFLAQVAAAPAIALFFGEPRLTGIVRTLALQFLVSIWTAIPVALMTRALDFKRQSVIDMAVAIGGSLVTLALALANYGVWAIVLGSLAAQAFRALAINTVFPWPKRPAFSMQGLRGVLAFGGQVTGARVLWFVYSQADVFIAGKLLGKELLGAYSVAMHLASLPVQKISGVMNQIAFPAFAEVQARKDAACHYLLKATRTLSFLAFPLLWGVSSIAGELVPLLLGGQWQSAVLPLQLLPIVMPLSMLSPFFNAAFHGMGHAGLVFRNVLTASAVMPAAFLIGAHWGLPGLAMAWVAAFPVVFFVNMHRMLPVVGLAVPALLGAIGPSTLCASIMYVAVEGARLSWQSHLGTAALTGALVAVGVLTYALASLVFNRKGVSEVLALFARGMGDAKAVHSTPQKEMQCFDS